MHCTYKLLRRFLERENLYEESYLLIQSEQNTYILLHVHGCIVLSKSVQKFKLCIHKYAVKSFFGCYSIPSGSRCSNVPNELVHGAGLPFLDSTLLWLSIIIVNLCMQNFPQYSKENHFSPLNLLHIILEQDYRNLSLHSLISN